MITEGEKNQVYFSQHLVNDYPVIYRQLSEILTECGIKYSTLQRTKDYWCRDFMPVQYNHEQYVQFKYEPDYLQNPKDIQYQTIPQAVTETLGELHNNIHQLSLNIDGGNFVFCKGRDTNYLVMNEKVMEENKPCERYVIEDLLRAAFECDTLQIVWMPWDREDKCGHMDSVLRYVGIGESGKAKVLTCLDVYDDEYASCIHDILTKHFEVVELKLSDYDPDISWAYINCLQTDKIIIVPGIGNKQTDAEAMEQIKVLYPQYEERIYQVQMRNFIKKGGGALNCCSWTIWRDMSIILKEIENQAKHTI